MATETNGGKRLSGSRPSDLSVDEIMNYARSSSSDPVDDSVVDEILRSISEQSDTPVPQTTRRTTVPPSSQSAQPARADATMKTAPVRRSPSNSYEAAARASQQASPAAGSTTGPMPDPAYYAMRDPAQTQSFQPARPTQRNTDRLPTIVDEKPQPKTTVVGKALTVIVAILVVVALVLGVKMLYILGPSLGLELPDLSKLPIVSNLVDMLPEDDTGDEQPVDDVPSEEEEDAEPMPNPTSITLDAEEITLAPGESIIITATLDVEDWDGTISWGTNDEDGVIATVTPIGPTTAEVTYVGEGRCWLAAVVGVVTEDGSNPPSATCTIVCSAPSETEEEITDEPAVEDETPPAETAPAEHVDIKLNTYLDSGEFSLKVGEGHALISEANDKITFTSSNESVATVSSSGYVTAKGAGTCTITATDPDGCTATATCRITG